MRFSKRESGVSDILRVVPPNRLQGELDSEALDRRALGADELNRKIIAKLQEDGRTPFATIARELDTSEGTVRNRVAQMIKARVLKIIAVADPVALGYEGYALIALKLGAGADPRSVSRRFEDCDRSHLHPLRARALRSLRRGHLREPHAAPQLPLRALLQPAGHRQRRADDRARHVQEPAEMGTALTDAMRRAEPGSAGPVQKRRDRRWFEYKRAIPWTWTALLGVTVWIVFFGLWEIASTRGWVNALFMPPPHQVLRTLYAMLVEQSFLSDVLVSIYRIVVSFLLACAVAIPIGVLMGCFRVVDAFFNPFVAAWRYLPAPSFIPLLLMWFGAGEGSKLALLFIGVVFFLATLSWTTPARCAPS